MEKKINEAVCRYGMEKIFNGVIVGYSGGADSSALLHYLKDRCATVMAVHINHMIRGSEADRDEEFCKRTCLKYGIEFRSFSVDIPALASERHQGLEETARQERYRIFKSLLRQNPQYKCIATAHNANDNAETVIFNLVRGSGANGLTGIKPCVGNVVRPLIYCTRDDIIGYCNDNNIEYVIDSTNADTDYTRNKIRHCILPEITEINPNFLSSCIRLGEILRADEEYILDKAKGVIAASSSGKMPKEAVVALDSAPLARALRSVSGISLDYSAVKTCEALIKKWQAGKMANLGGGVTFKLERDYCAFIKTTETKGHSFCKELTTGANLIDGTGLAVCINCDLEAHGYALTGSVRLKPEAVVGTLLVRSRQDGDTVKSGGMTKRLKRIFSDKHIPSHERDLVPVICDGGGVLAVPGIVARDGAFDKRGELIIKTYKKTKDGGINEEKE